MAVLHAGMGKELLVSINLWFKVACRKGSKDLIVFVLGEEKQSNVLCLHIEKDLGIYKKFKSWFV